MKVATCVFEIEEGGEGIGMVLERRLRVAAFILRLPLLDPPSPCLRFFFS